MIFPIIPVILTELGLMQTTKSLSNIFLNFTTLHYSNIDNAIVTVVYYSSKV